MKINKVQINGFGNISDKTLEFKDGINLIHGNNESGKSTLVYFIKSMYYGINKNKAGKPFSEVERFKPWQSSEFSGKVDYTLDNNKYSIYRDFNRNISKVFDNAGNDITSEFKKDKSRGAEIGFAHFGIDEETFLNSIFISQGNVIVNDSERNNMIQKLTNIIQSGDEAISYDKAKQKLHKYLLEEVGTERTHNKPINMVTREIDVLEKTRDALINNRSKKEMIEEKKKKITKNLDELTQKYDDYEKAFEVRERYARLISEREKEYEISIKLMEKEREEKEKVRKRLKSNVILLSTVLFAVAGLILDYLKLYPFACISIIFMLVMAIIINKFFNTEIKLNPPQDLDVIKENLKRKESKELEMLNNNGVSQDITSKRLIEIKNVMSSIEKRKSELILEEHKLHIDNSGLNEHLEKLNDVEEQLYDLYEKEENIRKLEYALKIATENLDEAYEEIKDDIVPHIERSIKNNIAITTNGGYVNTIYNDRQGLLVENKSGDIVSIDKLSMGTVDQMYLGFRFTMAEKMGNVPIFLDETFAYYDDDRLENILDVLVQKSKTNQVFIMTCTDREKRYFANKNITVNDLNI